MAVVYQVINLINGHSYIGVTRFTSAHRWAQHKTTAAGGKRDLYLYRAMRKYNDGTQARCRRYRANGKSER